MGPAPSLCPLPDGERDTERHEHVNYLGTT